MTTVLDALDKGTAYLEKKGIEDARSHMQLMVMHLLECSRIELYLKFDQPMSDAELAPLREQLKRRGSGEPLQHILGTVEFYRREFKTDARALIPRPETEELASIILQQLIPSLPEKIDLLDMGTGSGVLGLTLAAELGGRCESATLADVSHDALALAEENNNLLGLGRVNTVWSDLFSELPEKKYHLITANLPYISEDDRDSLSREVQHDPALALFGGKDGLDIIRDFIQQAPAHLHPGGCIALEIGHDQSPAVEDLLRKNGFDNINTYPDLNGIARFPFASMPATQAAQASPTS